MNKGGSTMLAAALTLMSCVGCSRMQPGFQPLDTSALRIPRECGVQLAMMTGRPERYRQMPPACALPTAEEVARSCAVQDRISAPAELPLPDYRVSALDCRYTNSDESTATCRFRLALPGETGEGTMVEVPFDHRFWADHGPTHHMYGTMWMLGRGADCTRDETPQ